MKKIMLALSAVLALSSTAMASDSSWLLCQNGNIAVNLFEHGPSADRRASEITLIYGPYLLQGRLNNVNSGALQLKSERAKFDGWIRVDYKYAEVRIEGILKLVSGKSISYSDDLVCKRLNND